MNTSTPTSATRTPARKPRKSWPASVTLRCHKYVIPLESVVLQLCVYLFIAILDVFETMNVE